MVWKAFVSKDTGNGLRDTFFVSPAFETRGLAAGAPLPASTRAIVLNTKSYVLAPDSYFYFKAKVQGNGLSQTNLDVWDTSNGTLVNIEYVDNGIYRLTALGEGNTVVTHRSAQRKLLLMSR